MLKYLLPLLFLFLSTPLTTISETSTSGSDAAYNASVIVYTQYTGGTHLLAVKGRGFVYRVEGRSVYIITAAHVVWPLYADEKGVQYPYWFSYVYFIDGRERQAYIDRLDTVHDMAVLYVPFADWTSFDKVVPIYNTAPPYHAFTYTGDFFDTHIAREEVTGILGPEKDIPTEIGTFLKERLFKAEARPGMSGGIVFDDQGEAVGILSSGNIFIKECTIVPLYGLIPHDK